MANIIEMPKLSDTMQVGTLVKWLKKEGDAVKSGDMLAEVETDKATMELESFFDGVLLKIFAAAGAQVPIGAALCAIGKAGETVEAPAGKPAAPAAPKSSEAPSSAQKDEPGASTAAKNEVQGQPAAPTPLPRSTTAVPAAVEPTAAATPAAHAAAAPARAEGERVKISPLARKLATEKKLDPARIQGTGPGGRIVRADVLAFEKSGGAAATAPAPRPSPLAGAARGGPIQEERDAPGYVLAAPGRGLLRHGGTKSALIGMQKAIMRARAICCTSGESGLAANPCAHRRVRLYRHRAPACAR